MKKVLLLVDIFYGITGGAERQIVELCKNIDRNQYQIYVACLSGHSRLLKIVESYGAKPLCLGIKRIYGFRGLKKGIKFAKFLKNEEIDVLMTYHFGSDIWGTFFGKWAGVPCIISNRRDAGFWKKRSHVLFYRILDRWVNKIIVVSKDIRNIVLREEKVDPEKTDVIYNGIDLNRFNGGADGTSMRNELGIPADAQVIGCVGNFRSVKGHKYLIEAAKTIIEKFPKIYVILIGGKGMKERGLKSELENMTNDFGLHDNVRFLGLRKDIPELLKVVDICVLPSLSEGLSNTLLEYMAAEKPIVATNVGGNPEVISDRINGMLVNKADARDLADKLIYLLENRNECERLSSKARDDVAQRFSIARMVGQYENLLKDPLADKE